MSHDADSVTSSEESDSSDESVYSGLESEPETSEVIIENQFHNFVW